MEMAMTSDPIRVLAEPDALTDPSSAYAWLREHRPIFWHGVLKTLLVSRYQEGVAVLRVSIHARCAK